MIFYISIHRFSSPFRRFRSYRSEGLRPVKNKTGHGSEACGEGRWRGLFPVFSLCQGDTKHPGSEFGSGALVRLSLTCNFLFVLVPYQHKIGKSLVRSRGRNPKALVLRALSVQRLHCRDVIKTYVLLSRTGTSKK